MTAQRPTRPKRLLAVSTALPAVILSSVALAQPAQADVPAAKSVLMPRTLPATQAPSLGAARTAVVPAADIPAMLPSTLQAGTPDTYTVQAGDTVTAIAARFGLGVSAVLSANGLQAHTVIYPGQTIKLAGGAPAAAAPAGAAAPASPGSSYTVVPGDTPIGIAAGHGLDLATFLSDNGLSMNSVIYPGQQFTVGGGGFAAASVTTASSQPATFQAASTGTGGKYTIEEGDTLTSIAAGLNIGLGELMQANDLSANSVIYPGKELSVPGGAEASHPMDLVPSTFLHYTYPADVVADANKNKATLLSMPAPSPEQMQAIVRDTAVQMGVDPSLAQAFSWQESGFNQQAVSPANAIGAMQVIPSSGQWASELVGRELNLLDPYDNATAGVAIISALLRSTGSFDDAIASYYQGQGSVEAHGMFEDTKNYVASVKSHQARF
jgi:N-acetylmuramoyl-L-alanine amidase